MPKILVSACLYGECTKYNGTNNLLKHPLFLKWKNMGELVSVCPEVLGGLPTPRTPSERVGDKVLMRDGRDVTENYNKGAMIALERAKSFGCTAAILKARSPSCGKGRIYDGSFSGNLTDRDGVTAELLIKNGIKVYTEDEIDLLLKDFS